MYCVRYIYTVRTQYIIKNNCCIVFFASYAGCQLLFYPASSDRVVIMHPTLRFLHRLCLPFNGHRHPQSPTLQERAAVWATRHRQLTSYTLLNLQYKMSRCRHVRTAIRYIYIDEKKRKDRRRQREKRERYTMN